MNNIVNKILLVGDTFMPKMRLEQPGFSHNACVTFTKNRERLQKIKIFNVIWLMRILRICLEDKACRSFSMIKLSKLQKIICKKSFIKIF